MNQHGVQNQISSSNGHALSKIREGMHHQEAIPKLHRNHLFQDMQNKSLHTQQYNLRVTFPANNHHKGKK